MPHRLPLNALAWRLPALLLAAASLAGCADDPNPRHERFVWTRSERLSLAPGKDFSNCAASAVASVPGLFTRENPAMKAYFDAYLVLGGPAVSGLTGIFGDLSLRGTTIQVEFTGDPKRLPDQTVQDATERLLEDLRNRVASQCS